jgi:hypothetical protein
MLSAAAERPGAILGAALGKLKPERREVLTLRLVEGHSQTKTPEPSETKSPDGHDSTPDDGSGDSDHTPEH